MGSTFQTMMLPGEMTRIEVEVKFAKVQNDDRHHNGHSFNGGFGMARGLTFAPRTFDGEEAACRWIEDNAQKWDNAIAVTFKDGGSTRWLIGAWCAC